MERQQGKTGNIYLKCKNYYEQTWAKPGAALQTPLLIVY